MLQLLDAFQDLMGAYAISILLVPAGLPDQQVGTRADRRLAISAEPTGQLVLRRLNWQAVLRWRSL
jgi:hypothetical protein